jgi:hypothetical protein
MEHNSHHVDILDRAGNIVSTKRRIDIRKPQDIYHTIHILLVTPCGEIILGNIPVREDLPNLYAQQMGTTAATIRRCGETAAEAAERCATRELFIDHMPMTLIGEHMYALPQDRHNYISAFYGVADAPESYSLLDIDGFAVVTPRDLDRMILQHSEKIADPLIAIWREYRGKLPI